MPSIERLTREQFSEPEPDFEYLSFDDAGPMLEALSSKTAQSIVAELSDDPATATEVADRAGTTLQNASYHLSRLEDAGLVSVVGTRYSEKGCEMAVYARSVAGLVIREGDGSDERA